MISESDAVICQICQILVRIGWVISFRVRLLIEGLEITDRGKRDYCKGVVPGKGTNSLFVMPFEAR